MAARKLIIGCGYLGRRVARRWVARGDDVLALTRSNERAAELRRFGVEPMIGDVTDPATLGVLPEADTLLYAVGLDRTSGKSQREVYVGGLENVVACVAGKVRRFLYVSSTSVYGQNAGEWVDEGSTCRPETENGKVCLAAEQLLQSRIPNANILRLAGIYGPGRLMARVAALRAGLVLEGNPDAWLNLIHVDDAIAAILACEERGQLGGTYLVGDDRPCRRRDYYALLAALVGAPPPRNANFPPLAKGGQGGAGGASLSADDTKRQGDNETGRQGEGEAGNATGDLNKRCCNRRLHEELQVTLRYPSVQVGLPIALTERDRG
jgi:nucleoside-diphosphate-sugar epimerase